MIGLELPPFPDLEETVAAILEEAFPLLRGAAPLDGTHIGTVLPINFKEHLPYVRISGLGGSEENIVTLVSTLDVDVYDSTRDGAYDLSEGIRAKLVGSPHRSGDARIDRVVLSTSPVLAEWPDNDIKRFIGTYRVSLRRR